ncbi:hypothetical protein A1O1_05781 [Capronia coronata CBS 617.96]|uniref:Uncharacterized protein n=1 Tax=Capronia coronata CBS 617.96 TaxID=1182541 RepID=W9XY19_9EURO|nr:uncharacterized protein A1O1_05781 [Capronia coronata CBS 617.96]EXJ85417.1 hypothetical protein A1O1_05781 [Capronia coronata CBS 617.96]
MCFKFQCVSCKLAMYNYCQKYIDSDQTWCNVSTETPWGSQKLCCPTCVTIKGAIQSLRALVFREPYLLTEGMAGAPKKEAWEVGPGDKEEEEDSDGGDPDGFTKEERTRVRAEAEAAVLKRWGLLRADQIAEQERDGEGDGVEEALVEISEE